MSQLARGPKCAALWTRTQQFFFLHANNLFEFLPMFLSLFSFKAS